MAVECALFGDQRDRLRCRMSAAANESKRSVTAANGFLAWLGHGLNIGTVRYNERGAFAHFGKEGLYLLSPIAFQEFVFLTNVRHTWANVQRGVQRKRISMRNPFLRGIWKQSPPRRQTNGRVDAHEVSPVKVDEGCELPSPHCHSTDPAKSLTLFTQRPWRP